MTTQDAWKAKWPNYCKSCGGWGVTTYYESHGFKYGPSEQIVDPCEARSETACHRCGMEGHDPDHEQACFFCGHNSDDGLFDEGEN